MHTRIRKEVSVLDEVADMINMFLMSPFIPLIWLSNDVEVIHIIYNHTA